MGFKSLDTEHFSDAEIAMKNTADGIENLKALLLSSRREAEANWVGKGRGAFESVFNVVNRQIEDISDQFFDMYDSLCDSEVAYMEADQEVATAISSVNE